MKLKGTITYTIDADHPDIGCVKKWTPKKKFTLSDVYTFNDVYEADAMELYIKNDLRLVAGGGYNCNHIHNVKIVITPVKDKHFMVDYGRNKLVFETLQEASAFCNDVLRKTGYVLAVTETTRKVTHVYEGDK